MTMDLAYFLDFDHTLKLLGLLLALAVSVVVLCLVLVGGFELVWHTPAWIKAKANRTTPGPTTRLSNPLIAGLITRLTAGQNTWTDIFKRREFLGIADWFISRFTVIGVLGILAAGAAAWLEKDYAVGVRVLALGIIFGAASMVGGWLVGLLFGVPRTVVRLDTDAAAAPAAPAAPSTPATPASGQEQAAAAGVTPPAAPAASPAVARARTPATGVNTNLTDISDWLTKTIVGVGLTQLYQAPHFFWRVAGRINDFGFQWDGHGQVLALALFIYFAAGGFWCGYVATRTVLTELLNQIDGVDRDPSQTALSLAELTLGYSGGIEPAPPGSLLERADAALLSVPRESLTSPLQIAAWGAAQARAGRLVIARSALETVHSMVPGDPTYRQLLAKVYSALGDRKDAQQLGPDPWLEVFNALYEPPPQGFMRAIEKGEALSAREKQDGVKSASLHLWLACAYGQKYAYQKQTSASADELAATKERALAESKAAIEIDPAVLPTLQSVWDAPEGTVDNDLTAFKDDDDFKKLLGPDATAATTTPPPPTA
jgi:hypothetical protein